MSQRKVRTDPLELNFVDVEPCQKYRKNVTLTNISSSFLELSLKPCPTLDRDYEIFPSELSLRPQESISVEISLTCSKPGTLRDVIHIISSGLSEKLYINIRGFEPLNSHFQDIVKNKEDQLQSSQSRIERLEEEIEELSEKLRISEKIIQEKERVEQEIIKLQEENAELRAFIEDIQRNEVYYNKLKEMMKEKVPSLENLIELTLQQEREKNERKNEKVLEILQIKDSLIEDFEEKVAEMQNAIVLMQHKLNDNKVLLTNTEKSLQAAQKTIEDLKTANFEKDQQILALKGKGNVVSNLPKEDPAVLKNELLKNFDHIKQLTENLQKYEQENSKLREREEYVLELSNRHSKIKEDHEKLLKEKEFIITELKAKLSTQSEHIESLILKLSQMNYSDILYKVSQLEEENKNLSKLLADSHRSSATFKKEELDEDGIHKINELAEENLKLTGHLKDFSEKTYSLEKIISEKNKEIIELQNQVIEAKKNENLVKAAPSPEEEILKLSNSLQSQQLKAMKLEEENNKLKSDLRSLENSQRQINTEISVLFDTIESQNFEKFEDLHSQNQLIAKITQKIKSLKTKENEALKAAAIAEEGIKILQSELSQEHKGESIKEIKKLNSELNQIKLKYELLLASNNKLKEELEEKKKIISEVTFLMNPDEKNLNKKNKKKIRTPPKIIKALISAKIGEADAVKKLKRLSKYELELNENIRKKEEIIKELEKDVNGRRISVLNQSIDESDEKFENSESNLQQKVSDLQLQIQEIKESEMLSWQNYAPLSLMWKNDPHKGPDDSEVLLEGFLHLIDYFSYLECEDKSSSIEKSQRIIIRALLRSQNLLSASEDKLSKIFSFQPSRDEDKKIWYVELLESQLEGTNSAIKNIEEVLKKINFDGQSSTASFKGAMIELAKSIKLAAEEVELVKINCLLIKNDSENLIGKEHKQKTETLKKKISEEVQKMASQKNQEISELKRENQEILNQLAKINEKNEGLINDIKAMQQYISITKAKINNSEIQREELRKINESLSLEMKEQTDLKQKALQRAEKIQQEMKDWQNKQIEILTAKERIIFDLQSQVKALSEEKNLSSSQKNSENSEFFNEKQAEEVAVLKEHIENLEKEIFYIKQASNEERNSLVQKIAELEENEIYYEKSGENKESALGITLKKDPDIQVIAIQTLLREKISLLDEETRKRIDAETKLKNLILTESEAEKKIEKIQRELSEKIEFLMEEVSRYDHDLKISLQEKDEIMGRYEKITQSLRETTENLRKTERDLINLQQEQKNESIKYTTKLQNTSHSSAELRTKLKEVCEINEKLKQENEGLYVHIKSLEKDHENTSQKLEDMEKVNSNIKLKIKDYEQQIEDLEEMRNIEINNHISQIESLKIDLASTYEEFEKTIDQYEGQINSLKDQFNSELKQKKNSKKPSEIIDYMLQISKKDSIIKSLKSELKSVKPKKLEKKVKKSENPQKEEETVFLQSQVYKLKAQLRSAESQLSVFKEELDKKVLEIESKPVTESTSKKDIIEIERRHRNDMQKLAEEVSRLREKWHSPEEWNQLLSVNRELEINIKKLNDDVIRKKEMVENLKAIKDQQDYENNAIQEELEQVKDYSEKVKKLKIEISRKDKTICDMKTSIENYKDFEKKAIEENSNLNDKIKTLKNDLNRKDVIIRDIKAKIESTGSENAKGLYDEIDRLKDKIKKLKVDCERKDTQIKNFKVKLETAEIQLETVQSERQNLSTEAFASLEKEVKKNERLQNQLRKTEAQLQSLFEVAKKIFKGLSESVENLRSKSGNIIDKEYYSDCLDILDMDLDDLSEFVGHRSVGTLICRVERLLEQGEDTHEILDIFNKLLDERLELERSINAKGTPVERPVAGRSRTSQGKNFKY